MNTEELNFAYKVRLALNENLDNLPTSVSDRLAEARKAALVRQKKEAPRLALATRLLFPAGGARSRDHGPSLLARLGLALPLLVLAAGLVVIYEQEQQQRIAELAEIDVALLSDELPLSAYLDRGFRAYITSREE